MGHDYSAWRALLAGANDELDAVNGAVFHSKPLVDLQVDSGQVSEVDSSLDLLQRR